MANLPGSDYRNIQGARATPTMRSLTCSGSDHLDSQPRAPEIARVGNAALTGQHPPHSDPVAVLRLFERCLEFAHLEVTDAVPGTALVASLRRPRCSAGVGSGRDWE